MAPVSGIVGKLPAHGDFVRRGGPPAVLALLDRWLDAELGAAVADGAEAEDAVSALDGWRFAFAVTGGTALVTGIASTDGVGREFPLVGTITAETGFGFADAERWCAAAADALVAVRDAGTDADAALAAIETIAPPTGDSVAGGWWRAGDAAPSGTAQLPTGVAFRALIERAGA